MALRYVLAEVKRQLRTGVALPAILDYIETQRMLPDDERAVLCLYAWLGGEPAVVRELMAEEFAQAA